MLALAVLGTAPLATWGGGCSSSLTSVQPDASGHAGATGAGGAAGTSGEAGTSGASGAGGCPECCSGSEPSYCSADGNYMWCSMQPPRPGCAGSCPPGSLPGYAYFWAIGAAGAPGGCATGGTSGAGGGAGTTGQAGAGGRGGQSGYSGGLVCAGGSGGAAGGSTGGAPEVCCPQCCSQPNAGPHCSDDGQHYLSCYMVPSYTFPPGCGNCGGLYVYVWQAQSCADGCVNPAGGASGGGNGGAPGCQ
jgi:hypothetical protein